MPVGEIVAGEWNRVLSTRKLDLVYGKVTLSERRLEARQVEIPHSGETVVIRLRQTAVILIKSLAPLFQRFRIVNPPNFDIRYEQSALFERRGRLRKRRGITAREYVLFVSRRWFRQLREAGQWYAEARRHLLPEFLDTY